MVRWVDLKEALAIVGCHERRLRARIYAGDVAARKAFRTADGRGSGRWRIAVDRDGFPLHPRDLEGEPA